MHDWEHDLLIYKPAVIQYFYFLALSIIETISFHISARLLTDWLCGTADHLGTMVSTALLISSCEFLNLIL